LKETAIQYANTKPIIPPDFFKFNQTNPYVTMNAQLQKALEQKDKGSFKLQEAKPQTSIHQFVGDSYPKMPEDDDIIRLVQWNHFVQNNTPINNKGFNPKTFDSTVIAFKKHQQQVFFERLKKALTKEHLDSEAVQYLIATQLEPTDKTIGNITLDNAVDKVLVLKALKEDEFICEVIASVGDLFHKQVSKENVIELTNSLEIFAKILPDKDRQDLVNTLFTSSQQYIDKNLNNNSVQTLFTILDHKKNPPKSKEELYQFLDALIDYLGAIKKPSFFDYVILNQIKKEYASVDDWLGNNLQETFFHTIEDKPLIETKLATCAKLLNTSPVTIEIIAMDISEDARLAQTLQIQELAQILNQLWNRR
jgi:hypothetical protein